MWVVWVGVGGWRVGEGSVRGALGDISDALM